MQSALSISSPVPQPSTPSRRSEGQTLERAISRRAGFVGSRDMSPPKRAGSSSVSPDKKRARASNAPVALPAPGSFFAPKPMAAPASAVVSSAKGKEAAASASQGSDEVLEKGKGKAADETAGDEEEAESEEESEEEEESGKLSVH